MNHRLSNINNLLKRCVAVFLLLLGVRCGAQAVLFAAQGGEEFAVYVDGDIVNKMPQRRVLVKDLEARPHQVNIVLHRPADKIVTLTLGPNEFGRTYKVAFNPTANHFTVLQDLSAPALPSLKASPQDSSAFSEAEVDRLAASLQKARGDDERLRLARESIGKRRLSEKQMDRLAAAFKSRGFRTKFLEWLKED